jgi:hypothetical protein
MSRPAASFASVLLLSLASLSRTPWNSQTTDTARLPALDLPAKTVLLAELNRDLDLAES